ncbi:MAG: DUF4129 domain-containing protein [Myxococcota bacterium]
MRWLILLAVACDSTSEPEGSALDDPAFRFCQVPTEIRRREEWCRFVAETPPERCPAMHQLCNGEAVEAVEAPEATGCNERTSDPNLDPAQSPRTTTFEWTDDSTQELLRWVGAFLVAALVLVLLRAFYITFGRFRRRSTPSPDEPAVTADLAPDDLDEALPDVPKLTSLGLIDRARASFAEGRWGEAAWLARGAALKHLHAQSLLRLHRSKTDREYLRAVRSHPEVADDLKTVVRAAERHRWGGQPVAEADANEALDATQRLLATIVAVLLMVGFAVPGTAFAQSDRYASTGDAGLARVLALHGYDAGYRLVSLEQIDERIDALFVDLSVFDLDETQWQTVRDWVDDGGILVAAGDVELGFEAFGRRVPLLPGATLSPRSPLFGTDTPMPRWPDGPEHAFLSDQAWVVADDGVRSGLGVVAELGVGAGVVIGIADARLFDNVAFADPANEAFMGDLLYLGQAHLGWPLPTPARIQLVTDAALSSQLNQNNPVASLSNARLLPFVLQLLAMWTLLSLWRGWPLARRREALAQDRLSFGEHVTALGTRWYRLGASGHALRELARLWHGRLGTSGLQLAAQRAGYPEAQARAFAERVVAAAETENPRAVDGDLALMEEIWTITRRTS